MSPLRIASLNIETLNNIDRQESLSKELNDNRVHIACLQETKLAGEGDLNLESYRVFYKGEGNNKYGVGIALKNTFLDKIRLMPGSKPTERIYHLIMRIKHEINVHIINVYAPQEKRPAKEKTTFYTNLLEIILGIPQSETVFIIGDFNAHVGCDKSKWPKIIGDHGYGKTNNNGNRLLRFCESQNLVITNTHFYAEEDQKTTWESSDGKRKSQLDLCITRQRDLECILKCDPIIHRIQKLGHKMLLIEIEQNQFKKSIPCIEKSLEISRSEKLLLETKNHMQQLEKKVKTEEFKDAWHCWDFKKYLREIIDKNEAKICDCLRDVDEVLLQLLNKESESDNQSTEQMKRYDTKFSELSKCFWLVDEGSSNGDNRNVSIFNDDFTVELNESTVVTSNFREISRHQIIEAIDFVIENSVTNFSILSMNREDLKTIFLKEEFLKLFGICWTQKMVPTEILLADIFSSHTTPVYNTIYVFSLFSEIFQYCIYRQLSIFIKQNETAHGFFTSFSQRELLFQVNLVHDWSLATKKPMYIAALDFSRVSMALDTDVILEHLEILKKEKKEVPGNVVQLLKSFLFKTKIYAKVDKTNDKSDIHKLAMQFVLSCFLTDCFTDRERNRGIIMTTRPVGNPFDPSRLCQPLETPIKGFVFDDLVIFLAHSKEELEDSLNCLNEFLQNEGFDYEELEITFSTNQTCHPHDESNVLNCFGEKIKPSQSIHLLGTSFGFCKRIRDKDIMSRIETARKVKEKMLHPLNRSEDIIMTIKRYTANILEPLLLNLDILTIDSSQEDKLQQFHDSCIREIQAIKNFDKKSLLTIKSIPEILSYRRLVVFGDVCRLNVSNNAKRMLYADVNSTDKSETFKELCQNDLKKFQIILTHCQSENFDRYMWIDDLNKMSSNLK